MRYFLAIDSGGTKTTAALVDAGGRWLGMGHSQAPAGFDAVTTHGYGRTREAVLQAVHQAIGTRDIATLEACGIGAIWPFELQRPNGRPVVINYHLISEARAAFALAGLDRGVVALAGTGAFVFASNGRGRAINLDGLGPVIGDIGSASHIGLEALKAAARGRWHRRHRTTLRKILFPLCGGTQEDSKWPDRCFIRYSLQAHDRSTLARFATVVDREARGGDRVSRRIITDAAKALAVHVRDAVETLKLTRGPVTVLGAGGVMLHSDLYWSAFTKTLRGFPYELRPVRMTQPPTAGYVLALARKLGGPAYADAMRLGLLENNC